MIRHFIVASLALLAVGCSAPQGTAASYEIVQPATFSGLDQAVQAQFDALAATVRGLSSSAPSAERAAAWSSLAGWYHLYGYGQLAIATYQHALSLAPEHWQTRYLLTQVETQASRFEAARDGLRQVVEAAPDYVAARVRLADLERMLGDSAVAASLYRQALVQDADCAMAMAGLADVAQQTGDLEAAARHLEAALALQPHASPLVYALSQVLRARGDGPGADALVRKLPADNQAQQPVHLDDPVYQALKATRTGTLVALSKGLRSRRAGRLREAVEHLKTAVAADDENVSARIHLALALAESRRLPAAIRELEAARGRFPEHAKVRYHLARMVAATGDLAGAEAGVLAALERDPTDHDARVFLGEVLARSKRYAEAVEHFRTARADAPWSAEAAVGEAKALQALGRAAEARRVVAAALVAAPGDDQLVALASALGVTGP